MTQSVPPVAPSALGAGEPPKWKQTRNASPLTAQYFLRSDAGPTGINAAENIPPEAIEAFRRDIAAGILTPDNDTARAMAQSFGGWRAGDITPLGPMINELPGGLTSDQWQAYVAKIQAEAKVVIDKAVAQGYFGATPPKIDPATGMYDLNDPALTFDARNKLLTLQQEAAKNATAKLLTEANIRQKDEELVQAQQKIDDFRRAGDLDRAQTLQIELDKQKLEREKLGEDARQFDNDLMLKTQIEAFTQQKAIAEAMANPRRSIEASFLATGRGGLGGLPQGNQLAGTVPGTGSTQYPWGTQPGTSPLGGAAPADPAQAAAGQAAQAGLPSWANQLTQAALGQGAQGGPGAPPDAAQAAGQVEQTQAYQALLQQYQAAGQAGNTQLAQQLGAQMEQMRAQPALLAGGPPGQPGGPDHYATVQHPDGTNVNYFGNVVRDGATGELANVPVGAFTRSLLEGRDVARNGALDTQGGYTFGSQLQQQGASGMIDPNRIKMRSYLAGNDTEQQEAVGALSYATGQSDKDLSGAFARSLPKQGGVTGGAKFTGSLMGGGGSERIGGGPITKAAAAKGKKKGA